MKIKIQLMGLLAFLFFSNFVVAQEQWNDMGNSSSQQIFAPQIVVANDTIYSLHVLDGTVFDEFIFRRFDGNSWVDLYYGTCQERKAVLRVDNDGNPVIAHTDVFSDFGGTLSLNIKIQKWINGGMTQIELIGSATNPYNASSGNEIDIFDFHVNPQGGYGVIYRYSSSFQATYYSKIGNNAWNNSIVFLQSTDSFGSTISTGFNSAKIIYTDDNYGFIVARDNNGAHFDQYPGSTTNSLVVFKFEHNLASSAPVNTYLLIFPDVVSSQISLTSEADTVFIGCSNAATFQGRVDYVLSGTANQNLNNVIALNSNAYAPKIAIDPFGNKYLCYTENQGSEVPVVVEEYTPDWSSSSLVGNGVANDVGNIVGEYSFALNNDEVYVFFNYGPPMNNFMARRFGCADAPIYSYNSSSNEITTSTVLGGAPSYEWFECGEATVLGTNATLTPPQDGDYYVEITNGSCFTTSNCVSVTTSVDNSNLLEINTSGISIYPNPANHHVTIETKSTNGSIEIHDLSGKIIHQTTITGNHTVVSCGDFSPGVYSVVIKSESGYKKQKLILQ